MKMSNTYGTYGEPQTSTQPHTLEVPGGFFGLSLSDAFRRFVIEDPEIAALGKTIIEKEGRYAEVFREGQYPGPYVQFNWPLDVSRDDLAFEFVRPLVFMVPGPPLPEPSELVRRVSIALVDRLQTLRRVLVVGRVDAYGTFARTGNFGPIHRLQWARPGSLIDIRGGDLLREINNKPDIQWSGVVLEAPAHRQFDAPTIAADAEHRRVEATPHAPIRSDGFHVKPTVSDGIRLDTTEPRSPEPSKGIAKVVTTAAAKKACIDWLLDIMRANPDRRTESNAALWERAKAKWPGKLSQRSFQAARAEAVSVSGAAIWAAPGRSQKSPR